QQVRQVGSRHEHEEPDGEEEHHERGPHPADESIAQRDDLRAHEIDLVAVFGPDPGSDRRKVGPRPGERRAVAKPSPDMPVVRRAALLRSAPLPRRPELAGLRELEARGHHADDAMELSIEEQGQAGKVALAREEALPERAADQDRGWSALPELFGGAPPAA